MQTNDLALSFLSLYKMIGKNGREAQLFGQPREEMLQQALTVGCLASSAPSVYWEFPLAGEPWLDCLVAHNTKEAPIQTERTDYPFMAAFARANELLQETFCYGLTWDMSQAGETLEPGFYIDHASDDAMVEALLQELGMAQRWPTVRDFIAKIPSFWQRYYLGVFPQREGTPVRFGINVWKKGADRYRRQPELLAEHLRGLGLTAFDEAMLREILDPVYLPFCWELQFDIYPDGSLGKDFAICFSIRHGNNKESLLNFQTEPMQRVFQHLEQQGRADQRWRLLSDCIFSKLGYTFGEERLIKLGMENRLDFLKLKWHGTKSLPAKFYFESYLAEL